MRNGSCRSIVLGTVCLVGLPFLTYAQVADSCRDQRPIDTRNLRVTSRCVRDDGMDTVTLTIETGHNVASSRLQSLSLEFCGRPTVLTSSEGWETEVSPPLSLYDGISNLILSREPGVQQPEEDSTVKVSLRFEGFWRHKCTFFYSLEPEAGFVIGAGGAGACGHDSCADNAPR
jgi:hypothetical protein